VKTVEIAAGSSNVLSVPRQARDEQGDSRSFNLDSFGIDKSTDPYQVLIHLGVAPKGVEQLVPFTVRLELGEPAAQQLADSLIAALRR
jgi:hypothetical protein